MIDKTHDDGRERNSLFPSLSNQQYHQGRSSASISEQCKRGVTLLTSHENPDNGATARGTCIPRGLCIDERGLSILPSEVAHGVATRARARMTVKEREHAEPVKPGQGRSHDEEFGGS